jgi:predicted DNA-binding transcriptional regulator YafY
MVRILKINRLLGITILLLNRETVTAKELAERFGVSTRTIYRDIDVLSSAGVPVFTNKGNGGGISLLENYSLNKTLISEYESESLLLALKTLKAALLRGNLI